MRRTIKVEYIRKEIKKTQNDSLKTCFSRFISIVLKDYVLSFHGYLWLQMIIPLSRSFASLISSVGAGGGSGFRFSGIFFSGCGTLNNIR